MKKRWLALALAGVMTASLLAGCGSTSAAPSASASASGDTAAAGKVYYLNFKPEQDQQWQDLAAKYTEQTGVPVTVVTAAEGTYETTLTAEMGKTDSPTLFQVNGPVGLHNWQDYCYDLSSSDIYGQLTSDDFALKGDDGAVYGIAYVIETYGIIYNKALLEKAGYTQDDINSFDSLKKVADDIQARKDELGVKGAFTSAGMDASSDWRFKTHLANLPLYYEYEKDGMTDGSVKGSFLDNYRAIWDLYITDATCAPAELSAKTGDDASNEFANGEAVFYQNGTWAYDSVKGLGDENLGMLPIYIGADGEADQGLCTGSENFWCVNKEAAPEDIQATLDFMNWVVTSEDGTASLANDMGFVSPFKAAKESANPLVSIANEYIANGKKSVDWCFATMPSEEWKNVLGSALTAYAADQSDANWDAVASAFVDNWAAEYQLANG
jgi:raffinose/stachyose/melibiose transport system substrate-binding protein